MMKIGIITSAYTERYGFKEGIKLIKQQGYECVDYQDFIQTDKILFTQSERDFEREICRQRTFFESIGMTVSQVHGPWRWPPHDTTESEREERFEKMSRAIWGTALLGCRYFVIHPLMPWGCTEDPEPQKLYDINRAFMERLTYVAKQHNVVICYENMPMPALSLASPEACLNLAKDIHSEYFKLCLDTGHCTMLGITPGDAVRKLGDYLKVLHIHDNNGMQDLHWIPFSGVIDWNDFSNALSEIHFDGTVSLETRVPSHFSGETRSLQEKSLYLSALQIARR